MERISQDPRWHVDAWCPNKADYARTEISEKLLELFREKYAHIL